MAAVIKEIVRDLAHNKIVTHDSERLIQGGHSIAWEYLPGWEDHCIVKCDIELGIEHLLRTKQVDLLCYSVLTRFMTGISIAEIEIDVSNARDLLIKILALLEDSTHYSDDIFLEKIVAKYPKYAKTKETHRTRLHDAGRSFEENL